MSDAVLVLNSGSSSIKFAAFEIAADEPTLLCKGLLDEHETAPRLTVTDAHGKALFEKRRAADDKDGNGLFADILDWLDREFHLPLIFAGFSFGAAIGLRAACPDDRVKAVIGLGVPLNPVDERSYDLNFLQSCHKPKLFVSGSRDQFGARAKLEAMVDSLPEPKRLVIIESADHFFEGRLRELRETIEQWVGDAVNL